MKTRFPYPSDSLTWLDALSQSWSGRAGANVPRIDGEAVYCAAGCCEIARVSRQMTRSDGRTYRVYACVACADDRLLLDGEKSGTDYELWDGSRWVAWQMIVDASGPIFRAGLVAAIASGKIQAGDAVTLDTTTDPPIATAATNPREPYITVRDRAVSDMAQCANGRTFTLGQPKRYDGFRMWPACVRMDDDEKTGAAKWLHILLLDSEVFATRSPS